MPVVEASHLGWACNSGCIEPFHHPLGPVGGLVAVGMVARARELAVAPRWVGSHCDTSEGNWNHMVVLAVDGKHRAANLTRESVKHLRSKAEASQ